MTTKHDWVADTVGALTDPIIVFPGTGWEQDLPENLTKTLTLERLAHQLRCSQGKADPEEATDLEALLYLYPASLAAPMGDKWTRIYLYLGAQVMRPTLGDKALEGIGEQSLDAYEMGELCRLKRWIHTRQVEARRTRRRQEKTVAGTEPKPAVVPETCQQIKFF